MWCLHNFLLGVLDVRSPVNVDATTGPHVSVLIQLPPHHQSKHCSLIYGPNSTLSASVREDHNEIEYTLHSLIAGVTYDYNVFCSIVFEMDHKTDEFIFTDKGTFTPGVSDMHDEMYGYIL